MTPNPPPTKTLAHWPVSRIKPDPDQPRKQFDERLLDELARNLAAVGQQCPVIGFLDAADREWLILVDGERRLRAARRVPLEHLDAVVLAAKPTAAELLLAQLSLGQQREKLSLPELADCYARLMREFGLTQKALAERLGTSETKVSNAFAVRRLRPELQAAAATLEPSVVPLVARLPADQQPVVMAFAAPADGKRPSRDEVQAFVAARRPAKTARAKAFAGETDGRRFRIELKAAETHDSLVEFLKGLIAVVQRYKAVPVQTLGQVAGG